MKNSKTLLKNLRNESPLNQKEMARLLDMKPSNLVRYEYGHRSPTPDLQLIYSILFDVSLREIFASIYKDTVAILLIRIDKLIADLEMENTSKNIYKLSFLREVADKITLESYDESAS